MPLVGLELCARYVVRGMTPYEVRGAGYEARGTRYEACSMRYGVRGTKYFCLVF